MQESTFFTVTASTCRVEELEKCELRVPRFSVSSSPCKVGLSIGQPTSAGEQVGDLLLCLGCGLDFFTDPSSDGANADFLPSPGVSNSGSDGGDGVGGFETTCWLEGVSVEEQTTY